MELPSFTTVAEYVPRHPSGSPSRQKMTESAILGLKRAKETVVGCFWEEGLSLLSHFCSFSCMDAMNDSYSAMQWPAAGLLHRRGAVLSLVYINIPGEKDENNAGNQTSIPRLSPREK